MKVIFLDIDGVLNDSNTFKWCKTIYDRIGIRPVEIDEEKVMHLKEIVDATDAKIVMSSSWRIFCKKEDGKIVPRDKKMEELMKILNKYDLEIYDVTPRCGSGVRQDEIIEWLIENKPEDYIVIDDDIEDLNDFLIDEKLVKTSFYTNKEYGDSGLCERYVNDAISKLGKVKCKKLK